MCIWDGGKKTVTSLSSSSTSKRFQKTYVVPELLFWALEGASRPHRTRALNFGGNADLRCELQKVVSSLPRFPDRANGVTIGVVGRMHNVSGLSFRLLVWIPHDFCGAPLHLLFSWGNRVKWEKLSGWFNILQLKSGRAWFWTPLCSWAQKLHGWRLTMQMWQRSATVRQAWGEGVQHTLETHCSLSYAILPLSRSC